MNTDILSSFRPALVMTALFAVLLGLAYPLALTGIGQVLFPRQANGSLVTANGKVVGSTVVGRRSRPSATSRPAPPPPARATTGWLPRARTSAPPRRRCPIG